MSRTGRRSVERKAELLAIMQAHRDRATSLVGFSRQAIAQEAGVTPQYVSMLIGPDYRAATEGLKGKREDCGYAATTGALGKPAVAQRTPGCTQQASRTDETEPR